MEDIVIIGAGGFGHEVAWLIEEINEASQRWNLRGFIDDDDSLQGKKIGKYEVIGKTESLLTKNLNVVIAVANPFIRQKIYHQLKESKNKFPKLIHPGVIRSDSVSYGKGVIVAAASVIPVDITLEDFVILDRQSNLGHGTRIESFSTLLPSTTISGNVLIESNVLIGTGTTIIQELSIGKNSIIGAGSTVIRDIPKNCTAVGVPAKPIKFHDNTSY